ncbi:unnamed protein product [Caenorhabditis angaria]|uniref:Phosphatidic acid phosphatase type 2/haloperoxidase domain-containing protein n=1 Tax=Caenorhabditis angaria TaxID=860376 RepID=A0A9P1J0B5_9PELO|nr:unnamed protein product [Caenorhabditis angaria]
MSEKVLRRTTFSGRLNDHNSEDDVKKVIGKGLFFMVLDIVIVLFVSSMLFFWFAGQGISPYERPFPCGDESIRQPFKQNTVGLKHLLAVSLGSPFFVVALVEAIVFFYSRGENRLSNYFKTTTIIYLKYLLIYATCTFAMEFLKCYIGRLRPHFVSICQPDWTKVDCSNPENEITVDQLVCTNPELRKIRTARTSFPSGHTAAAVHAWLFVVIYLTRMASRTGIVHVFSIRNFLVPLYTIWTLFTAVTRVTDNWHFPTDVLGGTILAFACILPAFYRSWTTTSQIYESRELAQPKADKSQ